MTSLRKFLLFVCLITVSLVVLTIGIHITLRNNALGFDYMFYWQAGRAFFMEGISPYSLEVMHRIQFVIFGRLALPNEYPNPFPYPFPILFIPLPLYFLSYDWSQAAWMAFNILTPVFLGMLSLPMSKKWFVLTFLLFYQVFFIIVIGNYALLIGMIFIVIFHYLITREETPAWVGIVCGIAMAWSTNKPQLVWLYILLVLAMAIRSRRRQIILGFFLGLIGFHLVSLILLPDWPIQWLNTVRLYRGYESHTPVLVNFIQAIFAPSLSGPVLFTVALILVGITIRMFWQWWHRKLPDLLMLAWCSLITNFADVSSLTPDKIVLLVPVFLWVIYQKTTVLLKIGWITAIAFTYFFFILTKFFHIPNAVEYGPILMYLLWLIAIGWHFSKSPSSLNPPIKQ